jgi:hypothetical protein
MLRITKDEGSQTLRLRLEGRLEGPWVGVLVQCWEDAKPGLGGRRLCVDLNDVTFVDALGKARLAEMHGQGAHLLAEDLETKAILAEIETGRADLRDGQSIQSNSHGLAGNVTNHLTQLQRLQVELHQINEEFAKAARPLARLAEMNGEQRERLADELRARLARWESVTQQISQVMETASANGHGTPKGNEGESR